jgi:sugar (pentulose or hexulose) kinase
MENYHIAVFDIGKTNKKLLVYDPCLNILKIEKIKIEEFSDGDLKHDNIREVEGWIIESLKNNALEFNIKAISISAHGATFTCIDEKGSLAIPELSYTTDPGEAFHEAFFNEMGSRESLQDETCTPDFNVLLNVAKGIKYAQDTFGDQFNEVKHILNLPQYFSYKLTGIASADPTYVGCHTYLWNFRENKWSAVVDKLNIRSKLPEKLLKPWDTVGTLNKQVAHETGLSADTLVTTGIHDSNASLLPHIISSDGQDFILNSTGTWCVIMHERENVHFNRDELGKVVFYNLSAFNSPIKTAIFMGGLEFEAYDKLIKGSASDCCIFDAPLYQKIISRKDYFILPGITRGTGQFPHSSPRVIENGKSYPYDDINSGKIIPECFQDPHTAFAVLNLSLAIQTKVSLDRVDMHNGLPIFTEGGFSNNEAYNILVGGFYPDSDVFLTNLTEATSFGAALMGKAAVEQKNPKEFKDLLEIDKIPIKKHSFEGLEEYTNEFLHLIE